MIDRDQHALDRRQQIDALPFARDRAQLLSLPHPAIQVGQLDGIDLAEQVAGKGVDADARILPAFVDDPGVSGMEAISLRDFKAGFLQHDRRLACS